ncbi:MAG: hypothetical protein J6386_04695 [Candidatus Synoicihabitans palmerolidicus]|nr:hypothetical protein [Candidatus Synoicihabitans palmerolidicus]
MMNARHLYAVVGTVLALPSASALSAATQAAAEQLADITSQRDAFRSALADAQADATASPIPHRRARIFRYHLVRRPG